MDGDGRQKGWGRPRTDDKAAYRQRVTVVGADEVGADGGQDDVAFCRRKRQVLGQRLQQNVLQRRRHRSGATERREERGHCFPRCLREQVGETELIECVREFDAVEVLGQSAERDRHQGALRGVDGKSVSHALLGNPSRRVATMSF